MSKSSFQYGHPRSHAAASGDPGIEPCQWPHCHTTTLGYMINIDYTRAFSVNHMKCLVMNINFSLLSENH